MSKVETITIDTPSGSNTMQIGSTNTATINLGVSGDTINVPAGVTIANAGTATGFGGANTPQFYAELSANQSVSSGSWTKINFNTEKIDTDGKYDNSSNYRFTPTVAGNYYVFGQVAFDELAADKVAYAAIYFNGSHANGNSGTYTSSILTTATPKVGIMLTFDTDDYVEFYAYHNHGSSRNAIGNSTTESYFGAYKLIT